MARKSDIEKAKESGVVISQSQRGFICRVVGTTVILGIFRSRADANVFLQQHGLTNKS
jgi:hypothetical protein